MHTCPFWRYNEHTVDHAGRCHVTQIPCRYGITETRVPDECPLPVHVHAEEEEGDRDDEVVAHG